MSSGDGEISAQKISLKGLAPGWTTLDNLLGTWAMIAGQDLCGLELAQSSHLSLFHASRGREIRWGARGLRLQSGLEFRGLGWQWIGWLVLAHVGELAGAGSQLCAGLGCWIGGDHGPDWQRTRAWDHAAGIAGLDCGLGLSYSLECAVRPPSKLPAATPNEAVARPIDLFDLIACAKACSLERKKSVELRLGLPTIVDLFG